MDGESIRQETYMAYMLRLWQAGRRDGKRIWHASLENPHTGERLAFGDAQDLLVFLSDLMATPRDTSPWQVVEDPIVTGVAISSTSEED
jgi:hypothetical protein